MRRVFSDENRWQAFFAGLVVLSALVFVQRTVRQPQFKPCDFAMYYTTSRAWITGHNPYDRDASLDYWVQAGGRADIMPDDLYETRGNRWMPILQFPSALPVL